MSAHMMMLSAGKSRLSPTMKGPPVGTASTTGTSMVATIPANVAGDILVLWVHEWSLAALNAAPSVSGWNLLGSTGYSSGGAIGGSLWWRVSTGSNLSATVTFPINGTARTTLGMVFDGNTTLKNPNPIMAATFGAPSTLNPPNQGSLFTNNLWLAFLGTGSSITAYPSEMLGLVNYVGAGNAGSSACAAYASFTQTAYDPAAFGASGTVAALPCTFVIVGVGS